MPIPPPRTPSADALTGIRTLLLSAFIIGAVYLGRDVLIPLALASLLTFLLAPLVTRLQRWLGRIGAVIAVVLMLVAIAVGGGWVLTRQVVDLASELPNYKDNISHKLQALKSPGVGVFGRLAATLDELKQELPGVGTPEVVAADPGAGGTAPKVVEQVVSRVEIVESPDATALGKIKRYLGPVLGPLGTAGLVLLLVVFMLLKREDLRARIIRLIGQGRISATTRAMGDAGSRVSRYLLMLLVVNVSYGVPVAIGLYFIGVPNAILWGALATILRFIPYLGPWIAAFFPVVLSIAVSPDWMMPLLTIGLFVVLELLSNNVMEPWLYGASTGVAPVALIIAAVFWTWMWGPVGLVLATPITVCMVVMGRHIPRMGFLSVLLSDEQALTPAEDCYHRLLRVGDHDEMDLVDQYLRSHSLVELYDEVLVPVIMSAEWDHRIGLLDEEQRQFVAQGLRDMIDELAPERALEEAAREAEELLPAARVYLLPARADRDEVGALMLAQIIGQKGIEATVGSAKLATGVKADAAVEARPDVVCISSVAPSSLRRVKFICRQLRARMPVVGIVVGFWGEPERLGDAKELLAELGAVAVVATFAEAQESVLALAGVEAPSHAPTVRG